MIFLVCVFSLVTTAARPTSEPVPAVVGTATTGAIALASARVHQSPTSSKSNTETRLALHQGDQLAGIERRAAAERHHAVMTARLEGRDAGREIGLDRIGLHVGEQLRRRRPRRASASIAFAVIGIFATTGSVTNSGLRIPAAFTASPSSLDAPGAEAHRGRIIPVAAQLHDPLVIELRLQDDRLFGSRQRIS